MNRANIQNLEIKYGGKLHEIDADVFIESLINYSTVTKEVSAYLSPQSKVDIKIKAPQEGSFIILLNLVAEGVETLFDADNLNYAATIVGLVADLYTLKKWVAKNGRPEKIKHLENSVEVSNNKGSTIIIDQRTFNIYQDSPRVRESLRSTFNKLKDREEITDFSIHSENKELFQVTKEDFPSMASDKEEIERIRQIEVKEKQELSLFKIVFGENYKWVCFYHGNKIYVSMKDQSFFEGISKGKVAFRSGDKLIADLEIEQVYNEAANTFVNDSYSIINVVQHIPRETPPDQTSIEIDELDQ